MKKLLLVLMVVALAAFLLVGCIPTTPADGDGEGAGNGGGIALPAITIADSVTLGTTPAKAYVRAGKKYEVTITFAEAVPVGHNVSAWIERSLLKTLPTTIPEWAEPIALYSADNITFKGETIFSGGCSCTEDYIYVSYGDPCCPQVAKAPFVVDNDAPYACMLVEIAETCTPDSPSTTNFYKLSFTAKFDEQDLSGWPGANPGWCTFGADECFCTTGCCGDGCSGLKSWQIDIYAQQPYDSCCKISCAKLVQSSGEVTGCPIEYTTDCLITTEGIDGSTWMAAAAIYNGTGLPFGGNYYYFAIVTLKDYVGHSTTYHAKIDFDPIICDFPHVLEYQPVTQGTTMCCETFNCPDWVTEPDVCGVDCFYEGPIIGKCK